MSLSYFFFSLLPNKTEITFAELKRFPLYPLSLSLTHGFTHGNRGMKSEGFTSKSEALLSPSPSGLFHLSVKR